MRFIRENKEKLSNLMNSVKKLKNKKKEYI
jgi:hypothetical protein